MKLYFSSSYYRWFSNRGDSGTRYLGIRYHGTGYLGLRYLGTRYLGFGISVLRDEQVLMAYAAHVMIIVVRYAVYNFSSSEFQGKILIPCALALIDY